MIALCVCNRFWLLSFLLLLLLCAKFAPASNHKRVIGGIEVHHDTAPWLVSLTFYQRDRFITICGASIIHRRFLLTAAHCFYYPGYNRILGPGACPGCFWKARFGSETPGLQFMETPGIPEEDTDWYRELQANTMFRFVKMEEKELGMDSKRFSASKRLGLTDEPNVYEDYAVSVIPHPKYIPSNNTNDIAVVVLSTELPEEILPLVEILRLPPKEMASSMPKTREICKFAGWGCLHSGANPTNVAYILNMTVRSDNICEAIYKRKIDTKKQICAGTLQADHKGTCRGDSGGPLICVRNKQDFQAGILSFGIKRREAYTPSVFLRVTPYVDWIKDTMKKN